MNFCSHKIPMCLDCLDAADAELARLRQNYGAVADAMTLQVHENVRLKEENKGLEELVREMIAHGYENIARHEAHSALRRADHDKFSRK